MVDMVVAIAMSVVWLKHPAWRAPLAAACTLLRVFSGIKGLGTFVKAKANHCGTAYAFLVGYWRPEPVWRQVATFELLCIMLPSAASVNSVACWLHCPLLGGCTGRGSQQGPKLKHRVGRTMFLHCLRRRH